MSCVIEEIEDAFNPQSHDASLGDLLLAAKGDTSAYLTAVLGFLKRKTNFAKGEDPAKRVAEAWKRVRGGTQIAFAPMHACACSEPRAALHVRATQVASGGDGPAMKGGFLGGKADASKVSAVCGTRMPAPTTQLAPVGASSPPQRSQSRPRHATVHAGEARRPCRRCCRCCRCAAGTARSCPRCRCCCPRCSSCCCSMGRPAGPDGVRRALVVRRRRRR
jgi:hypothetical protein